MSVDAPTRRLADFQGHGYDIGRSKAVQALWLLVSGTIFMRWWLPASARVGILRAFGAHIGEDVLIRHRVRIHWPWKLSIGDNTWLGEDVWILNLEPVIIGSNVCVSQSVLLCTGSHQRLSPSFEFDNGPIVVEDGAWVAARATILRGVTVGAKATIGATAMVRVDVPPEAVLMAAAPQGRC